MYVVKVLDKSGVFVEHNLAGKFSRKERAEGAVTMLQRMGEDRQLQVEAVIPGTQDSTGQTLWPIDKRTREWRLKVGRSKPELPPHAPPAALHLTGQQVATLVSSIRPAKESGEFEIDLSALKRVS